MSEADGKSDDDLDLNGMEGSSKDGMNDEVEMDQVREKIEVFRMIHENKCEDGKSITAESRIRSLNEIKALYDELEAKLSLEVYMTRVLRWTTYREDLRYWETWDKKEEFIKRNSRSKDRNDDRIRSRNMQKDRSRSRSRDRMDDRRRDRSRERNNNGYIDNDNNRRDKERVK